MASEAETVESLMELGLSEYEARCFVALTQLSDGTAKEVSQVADVPQSRVYDVANRLYERGLVDVQESNPKRYYAVPVSVAVERIQQEFTGHLERATENLERLESRQTEEEGVWEMATQQDVINRVVMHAENAADEIYLLVGTEALLEDDVLDALTAAGERDVSVFVEVPTAAARERVREELPDAQVALSDLAFGPLPGTSRRPGRLVMIDRETILMSAVTEGVVPTETDETGVWGSEGGRGLVVWLRELLASRLDALTFEGPE